MIPRTTRPQARAPLVALVPLLVAALAGCGTISTTAPPATPADFPAIASELAQRDFVLDDIRSGDPGCNDRSLAPTAIAFTARGLDQAEPTPLYVYIFRNRAAFERRRADVHTCVRSYATDPDELGTIEHSPFILAGPGPWAPRFEARLQDTLRELAGTGG